MNGLHTEYSNLTPYHIQWLDGCGKLWKSGAPFSEGPPHLQFVQFGFEDEEWKFMIGHPGTHCPTGDAFCQGIAEILGIEYVPEGNDQNDHTESHVKPAKGMAIEVSRLSDEDRGYIVGVRNKICDWHMWKYCSFKDGRIILGDELYRGLTITESPTEFLEYVGKQTGKEYESMNSHQAVTSGTNDQNDHTESHIKASQPYNTPNIVISTQSYPHKTYRILDSLDGIPLDTRFKLSEWIPPFGVDVNFVHNDDFDRGHVHCIAKEGIIVKWRSLDCVFEADGHWMRIV